VSTPDLPYSGPVRPALADAGEAAAPDPVNPAPVRRYHDFLRLGAHSWWRGALAITSFIAAYLVVSGILSAIAIFIDLGSGRLHLDDVMTNQLTLSPALMLANNLSLAAMIPVAMLLQWAIFGIRPGSLSSVAGRFRRRWMLRSALVIVPIWVVYVGSTFLLEPVGQIELSADAIALLLIVLLTTPLQSAGEEYGARGLLNRAAASWTSNPRIGFVLGAAVSSALFAAAHVAGDPWLIAYYIVFGVALCAVSTATGGLEAAVLIHAMNNLLLLVPTVLAGQQDSIFERGEGTGGPFMLIPMAVLAIAAAIVIWWARRSNVQAVGSLPARTIVAAAE